MKDLFILFVTFFKLGATTFGGGYAMLPIIQREIVENRGWATEEEIMDYYSIGQCTPGLIAINTSTFTGYKIAGVAGGITATLGFVLPSIIVITVIAALIQNFADIAAVKNAFAGIRVCVCVLVLNAIMKLWKSSVVDKLSLALFLTVLCLSVFLAPSPVLLVLMSGAAGIAINLIKTRRQTRSLQADTSPAQEADPLQHSDTADAQPSQGDKRDPDEASGGEGGQR